MGAPKRPRRGRGEGSIEELRSGKFRAVVSAGKDARGKRVKLTATFDTKKQAVAWRNQKVAELSHGATADAGALTVWGWLDDWLAARRDTVEETTWHQYEQHCRLHLKPALSSALKLRELAARQVPGVYRKLREAGLSPAMRAKVAATLRTALDDAVRAQLLAGNPARAAGRPKAGDRPQIRPLDAAQARRLVEAAAPHRLAALYALALDSGLRQGEILALHWPEVLPGGVRVVRSLRERAGKRSLKDVKTAASRRTVSLAPGTCAALERHREAMRREGRDVKAGPVFVTLQGNYWIKSNLKRKFDALLNKAGLPRVRFQDLRHTCATLLLTAGVNVRSVAARLGHASPGRTLNTYAHHMPESDARMALETQRALWGEIVPPLSHGGLIAGEGI